MNFIFPLFLFFLTLFSGTQISSTQSKVCLGHIVNPLAYCEYYPHSSNHHEPSDKNYDLSVSGQSVYGNGQSNNHYPSSIQSKAARSNDHAAKKYAQHDIEQQIAARTQVLYNNLDAIAAQYGCQEVMRMMADHNQWIESLSKPSHQEQNIQQKQQTVAQKKEADDRAARVQQERNRSIMERHAKRQTETQKKQLLEQRKTEIQQCLQGNTYLHNGINKYKHDLAVGHINNHNARRWQNREQAIKQSKQNNFEFKTLDYPISDQVADFLKDSCIESDTFKEFDNTTLQESLALRKTTFDGSAIQHCLQQEMSTIVEQAAAIRYAHMQNQSIRLFIDTIGGVSPIATEFNQTGDIAKTSLLNDFCWSLLDVGIGIGEGVGDGVYNTAQMILHPWDSAVDTVQGITTAAWYAGKVMHEICGITKDCVFDRPIGLKRLDLACANITAVTNELGRMSGREAARAITGTATQILLTKKCTGAMNTFYKSAQTQSISLLKKVKPGTSLQAPFAGTAACEAGLANKAAASLRKLQQRGEVFKPAKRAAPGTKLEREIFSKTKLPKKKASFGKTMFDDVGQGSKLVPLGRGSTGRTEAKNLVEQIVMKEAMADPSIGKPIGVSMTDPRWHENDGWHKRAWHNDGVEVHYVAQLEKNTIIAVDDFKFKYDPSKLLKK